MSQEVEFFPRVREESSPKNKIKWSSGVNFTAIFQAKDLE